MATKEATQTGPRLLNAVCMRASPHPKRNSWSARTHPCGPVTRVATFVAMTLVEALVYSERLANASPSREIERLRSNSPGLAPPALIASSGQLQRHLEAVLDAPEPE
jgi:hypothetical protein